MTAGLYFSHPSSLEHDPSMLSPGHPDTPERLLALERALAAREWPEWQRREAPAASNAELELAHSPALVAQIAELCAAGGGAIDADTFVGAASFNAARHAAGGAAEMVRALVRGEAKVGFCAVRPSGHHAERDRAMGFCLFNNVAVAAAVAIAQLGLKRVFVLDWDVHHGNGTAEIFHGRSDVLFASLHQHPLYPGTGPLRDLGSGEGEGYTINLPVPPGSREPLWIELLERVVLPAARAFEPELVLVSSGVDAHAADPLASCALETSSFVRMTRLVRDFAHDAGAPLGVVQEGGYEPEVLAECVCAMLDALTEEPAATDADAGAGPAAASAAAQEPDPLTARAIATLGAYWPL